MIHITDQKFDEERALYGINGAKICSCSFEGDADGESALKEASNLEIENCMFKLRYPLWHVTDAKIKDCHMTDTCRAAMWYDKNMSIKDSSLGGIKALRECEDITVENTKISSTEFGWFCKSLSFKNCSMLSEYPFLKSKNMEFSHFELNGKYSFQYTENVVIRNCVLNTKDAFWHSRNVTVYDSVITGEYLGWYCDSLKLVRCKVIGTQPLCYADNLVLEDCEMTNCDLAFENSDVNASIKGFVDSIKNPRSGCIKADGVGEIISDNPEFDCIITINE